MKRRLSILFILLSIFLLGSLAGASTITGTVRNGTTSKPSGGDDVILLKLAGGMEEETRTKSDSKGRFTLEAQDGSTPHLVRVMHQKVMYHAIAPPGTATVGEVVVYEAAPKLQGISGSADVMRMQSDGGTLKVTEMFALRNNSTPSRTLMSDKTFEIYLPAGAQMDGSMAAGPGGMAVNSAPVPLSEPGHYAFVFPLRPGETQFRIEYHMPYSGSADFTPHVTVPVDMMAIELPKSIAFSTAQPGSYNTAVDEKGVVVQVAKNVAAGAGPAFHIVGTGAISPDALKNLEGSSGDENSGNGNGTESASAAPANRPGGGMAVPEGTPDPMDTYRWPLLIGFVVVLGAGAFWMTRHQGSAASIPMTAAAGNRSGQLLEALKEELFQLESDRLQQKISGEEYAKAKAALDTTLARAMQRVKN
ncbi:MAG TPA: carboxypeptidase regulatory-like domain-containing protein [Terriglobales bacterium]|nr:carboxypeptidase regulatory-like domain-containing protein [Terriglobales bacterium]